MNGHLVKQYICGLYINMEFIYLCSYSPIVWTDTILDSRKFNSKREVLEEIDQIKDKLKKELHGGTLYILGVKCNIISEKEVIDLEHLCIPQ